MSSEPKTTTGVETVAATGATTSSDPFATPASSRPSSLRPRTATSTLSSASASRTPSEVFTPVLTPRSILNPPSSRYSTAPAPPAPKPKVARMRSHMLSEKNPMLKPWNDVKNPRATFSYYLTYAILFIGAAAGAVRCYFGYKGVRMDKKPLCLVFEENFDNPETVFGEGGSFFREVNMDGFGNGEFSMATASQNNSFVQDGKLYIVPTLTSDSIGHDAVFDGAVYNITGCTFNTTRPDNGHVIRDGQRVFDWDAYRRSCSMVSNSTAGTIINPVQSARLTTRYSASIKYGRVEVRAKMPEGDWMWPAIWMLPRDEVYGPWPLSGEIDIVESRGNGLRYTARGSNYVQGTLNWGPTPNLNGASKSYSWWTEKRRRFNEGFQTYALEWTEDWLRIYVDTRLHTLLDIRFNKPFFQRGDFPPVIFNGSDLVALQNPWINGTNATPFDQEFFLILNVAVGSTNGWFPEVQGDKPWLDRAENPMRDFAKAQSQWYPTWPSTAEQRGMVVDYVKMWKHC
ncbi:Beta-1,3-glucan-binding protein [Hypsizygus marmoreus]|uniref:Beta-1,3-glucan-binding protein n=1 Tax=Hypsizygus marmoreus TaxID=39966 RepID=A0A369JWB2_HYPMA|nr:Beta-1,3-glucan-binding protein [Hypsizygus marmoreus]